MALQLATERFASLQTAVRKHFGTEFDFANQLISEFVAFYDMRKHKYEALVRKLTTLGNDVVGEAVSLSFGYRGVKVYIEMIRVEDDEDGICGFNHAIVHEGDCVCFVKICDSQSFTLWTPLGRCVAGFNWSDVAASIMILMEDGGECSLCGMLIPEKFPGICDSCLLTENTQPCRTCKRKIGKIRGGDEHEGCKRRRLLAERAAQRAPANSNNPP